jgi:hypothetical protein
MIGSQMAKLSKPIFFLHACRPLVSRLRKPIPRGDAGRLRLDQRLPSSAVNSSEP